MPPLGERGGDSSPSQYARRTGYARWGCLPSLDLRIDRPAGLYLRRRLLAHTMPGGLEEGIQTRKMRLPLSASEDLRFFEAFQQLDDNCRLPADGASAIQLLGKAIDR